MASPGLLFITSKLKTPNEGKDKQFNHFHSEQHVPSTFFQQQASINKSLELRFKNADSDASNAYLALIPVPDSLLLVSPERPQVQVNTRENKGLCMEDIRDHIEFGFRPYEKIQTFEGYGHASKTGKKRGQTIVCVAMEPAANEAAEQDLDDWYRKQHLDIMSMVRNYRRTTRYKRLDGQKPRYLALHEYACRPDELATEQIAQLKETEWSRKILEECLTFDRNVFELIEVHGEANEKL